jgi:hypothetical protein
MDQQETRGLRGYLAGDNDGPGGTEMPFDDSLPPLSQSATEQGQVWTMPESRVYHTTSDCPALGRSNRYYAPHPVPFSEATGSHPYRGQRRLCALCASASPASTDSGQA